jgi:hypothetical protein
MLGTSVCIHHIDLPDARTVAHERKLPPVRRPRRKFVKHATPSDVGTVRLMVLPAASCAGTPVENVATDTKTRSRSLRVAALRVNLFMPFCASPIYNRADLKTSH